MNTFLKTIASLCSALVLTSVTLAAAEGTRLTIIEVYDSLGFLKPVPINLSGFTGEVDTVLKNDLIFMGFTHVPADQAQILVAGNNNARVEARVSDRLSKNQYLAKAYTGNTLRAQAHALADDIATTLTRLPGIAQSKIAFKAQRGAVREIYIADYDGHNPQAVTTDGNITFAPCWAGRGKLLYGSYKLGNADIYSHELSSGTRQIVARYAGSNISPAVSPDGTKVAMILSKGGSPDLYVGSIDGSNLRQLTRTREEESSPCWSPDGRTICYSSASSGAVALYKISASGGSPVPLRSAGLPRCTEPDWSPDGKFIVFTSQAGNNFTLCLAKADGSFALSLGVEGEDPSWAPNSRAVIFVRHRNHNSVLSLLDVPTKQVKDVAHVLESNSQPSWAK